MKCDHGLPNGCCKICAATRKRNENEPGGYYTHDYVFVRGEPIWHSVAQRDWVCGECGSRLLTRWFDSKPNWRTVCTGDADHLPDAFIHKGTWAYRQAQTVLETEQAQDVLAHLPTELRAAIVERRE